MRLIISLTQIRAWTHRVFHTNGSDLIQNFDLFHHHLDLRSPKRAIRRPITNCDEFVSQNERRTITSEQSFEEFRYSFCDVPISPRHFVGRCQYHYSVILGRTLISRIWPCAFYGRCNENELCVERYDSEFDFPTAFCVSQKSFVKNPTTAATKQFSHFGTVEIDSGPFTAGTSVYAMISNTGATAAIEAKKLSIDALMQNPNGEVIVSSRFCTTCSKAHFTVIPENNNALRAEASIEDMVYGKIFLTTISG